jgi:UDP-N-acetylmuramyl pentapeptide synthase
MCGLALLSSLGVKAQTISWVIQPQYTSIEPYSEQLYKVKSGYQSGLIDKEGQLVVPVTADSITTMRNGHALSLKYTTDGRFKLIGITGTNGKSSLSNFLKQSLLLCNFKVKNVDCVNEPAFTCQRACV